jgi:hypothetical protein
MGCLKTTLEIPDLLYRRLKASAAQQGKSVKTLVNEAIAEKMRRPEGNTTPGWRRGFGQLRHLHEETCEIDRVIAEEFSKIDPEDWK